jgi:hypothetical protein
MGVRTVGQLRKLDPVAVESIAGIPVSRLQAALEAAAHPAVIAQEVIERGGRTLLAIHGANLADGTAPEVRLAGTPVEVLEFRPGRLLVRPGAQHTEGQLEVVTRGRRATGFFRLPEREDLKTEAKPARAGQPAAKNEPQGIEFEPHRNGADRPREAQP